MVELGGSPSGVEDCTSEGSDDDPTALVELGGGWTKVTSDDTGSDGPEEEAGNGETVGDCSTVEEEGSVTICE